MRCEGTGDEYDDTLLVKKFLGQRTIRRILKFYDQARDWYLDISNHGMNSSGKKKEMNESQV